MTTNTSTPSAWDNPSEGVQVPTRHPLGSATPSTHKPLNDAYRHLLATDTIQLWLAAGGEYTLLGDDWETSPTDQPTIALDDPAAPERITLAVEAANFFCKETWAGLADATMDMVDSERRANDTLHSYTCNDNTNTLQEAQIKSSATRILTTLNSLTRYPHGKLDNPINRRYLLFIEHQLTTYLNPNNNLKNVWALPFEAYEHTINYKAATEALANYQHQWRKLHKQPRLQ
jgi:hypothetical protein